MATNLGSKIIARLIVLWQAKQKGISVECNTIYYLLNRDKNNKQRGLDFANEPEQGLYPAKLKVEYVLEFDDLLPFLEPHMRDDEYRIICEYQKNPSQFQDKAVQKEVLALVA